MGGIFNKGKGVSQLPVPTTTHKSERHIEIERTSITEYRDEDEVTHYRLFVQSKGSTYRDSIELQPGDLDDLAQVIKLIQEPEA